MNEFEIGLNDRRIATWFAIIGLIVFALPCGIASVIYSNRAINRGVPVEWQLVVGYLNIVIGSLVILIASMQG